MAKHWVMALCLVVAVVWSARLEVAWAATTDSAAADYCHGDPCQNGGTCTSLNDSYSCACVSGKWEGQNCTEDAENNCAGDPCKNGATCTDDVDKPSCACAPGWTGDLCETDILECENTTLCQNNGTCNELPGSYNCSCVAGWTGYHCETDIKECSNNPSPCKNGGTCNELPGSYNCSCQQGWTGDDCETDIKECTIDPTRCENGGTCEEQDGSYGCNCAVGWTGTNCETDIEECSGDSTPCQNDGNCTELQGSYSCSCSQGWTGTDCETDIKECLESPSICQHNGTCTDQLGSFECACPDEWIGDKCEKVNYCYGDPCQNGAACTSLDTKYMCACEEGVWGGNNCTDDIEDNCAKANYPCKHGSTCVDRVHDYTCECVTGTTGKDCGQDIVDCIPGICQNGGLCAESIGSYECFCISGWKGGNCTQDEDECTMNTHNCDIVSQECRNLNGSFECICKDGYREVEGRCDEIVLWPSYGNTSLFEKVPAGQSRKVDIPVSFPYFGKVFSSLMVYPNGFVSFGPYEFTDPTPGPASWPNSPPLFSVYWADIVFGTRNKDAGVWIEQASLYDDVTASPLLLTKVKETVLSFNPVWATAVTWVHAQPNLFAQYPNDRASFQLILATDGEESYAVLNYDRVWPNTEYAGRPRVSYAYSGASGAYTNHDAPADKTKQVVNLFNGTASPSAATYQCLEKLQAADAALNRSLAGLPICPCLKLQAETDRTFKASTTPDSDPVCYNSRFWKNDARQTCCYSRDYGLLISNGDGAGYPKIKVATGESSVLKTAFDQCCNLTCHLFYRRYPTSNCSLYEAPKIGAGFGDPHLETFDGNKFTFNGWGDFTVFTLEGANNVNIQLQGRTDKTNGQNSTFFTAYAFRMSPDSDTYYFKMLEGTGAKTIKGLWKNDTNPLSSDNYDIDIEKEKIIFDTSAGVSVTITLQGDHLMHTVIVQSGLGYTTKGLMGTLNGNKADDFLYSSGTSKQGAVENLSGEDINSFAKSWRVKEADSLFNYSSPNLSYDDVNKHENFELPVLATSVAAVLGAFSEDSVKAVAQELCGNNLFCLQDYFLHQKNDSAEEVLAISNSVDQEKGKLEAAELVFKNPAQVSANAPGNMSLTVDSGVSGGITFSLQADSPFGSLDGSNFVWNITNNEEALRALKYPQMLQFFAKNTENVTGKYRPTIKVCLCDDQTQCSLNLISAVDEGQDPTGNVVNVVCDCGDRASGRYCTVPVDPCKNCFNESSCNNTLSEDYCQPCPSGYEGDGFVCRDINECLDNSTCEHHCNNTDGSYECSCNTGYTLQGSKCIDGNECLDDSCGADSYCVNTPGSFSCQCYPGLIQSGPDTCVKLKEIYNGSLVFTSINDQKWSDDLKDDKSEAFSKLATKVETAIKTSVNQSAFKELVPKVISFTQVPAAAQSNRTKRDADPVSPDSIRADFLVYSGEDPITTTDIDNALTKGIPSTCTNNCGYNGLVGITSMPYVDDSADVLCSIPAVNTCDPLSTDGCYEVNRNIFCNCSDGFTENFLDPSSCEDIDECATLSSADCNDCLNIAGSYSCSCPNGQAWDSLLSQCKDTPCRSKPCKNGGECHLADTASGFSCSCTSEYEGPTCEMEDDEFRRMKVAVICVSVILGVFCFILLIVLIVMCVRQRKSESDWTLESHSYTNSRYGDFGGLPRPKVRDVGSAEMAENGSSNVYDNPASVSDPDNRYTSFGKKETGPESKYVYKNNAYDETEGAKL